MLRMRGCFSRLQHVSSECNVVLILVRTCDIHTHTKQELVFEVWGAPIVYSIYSRLWFILTLFLIYRRSDNHRK